MRLSTPIARHLRGDSAWLDASKDLKIGFRERMRGRSYGYSECLQAWHMFRAGWGARIIWEAKEGP